MLQRIVTIVLLASLSACATVGNLDTAAMQTTNRAMGAPVNGPSTH
ncbi:hypothetical protein NFI95_15235 [Acetobacteraceae bacterium KSS8]|uniref:Entericidin n=1 Tax=Endosaccharibacter trunci TaxID=2812733 RepID=A0ABT1WDB2_9PROT|nr:hypothetical protein [Acetobacteraceae bacterium KSS8]